MKTFKNKIVKTRKPHICWGCAEEYQRGTMMQYVVNVIGKKLVTTYWCEVCQDVIRDWKVKDRREIDQGDIKKKDPKLWKKSKKKMRI